MTGSGLNINNYQLQYQLLKPATANAENGSRRQEVAAMPTQAAKPAAQHAPQQQNEESVQQQTFLAQLMDQMLANRIGLDKQKYDELTQKIAETEAEKDELLQKPPSPARDNQIAALDTKIEQLTKALQGLVEQANRNREQNERTEQAASAVAEQYRTAAYGAKEPTLFL